MKIINVAYAKIIPVNMQLSTINIVIPSIKWVIGVFEKQGSYTIVYFLNN